jgi:hypothetical protein
MANDKTIMAKWDKVADPKKALEIIAAESHMFYGDSYYRELIDALMRMAERCSK